MINLSYQMKCEMASVLSCLDATMIITVRQAQILNGVSCCKRKKVSLMPNVYDCAEALGEVPDMEYHLVLGKNIV